MSEHRYDINISESWVDPNPLMVERQDPDNFTRFQTRERCALEIAAYVFNSHTRTMRWPGHEVIKLESATVLKFYNLEARLRIDAVWSLLSLFWVTWMFHNMLLQCTKFTIFKLSVLGRFTWRDPWDMLYGPKYGFRWSADECFGDSHFIASTFLFQAVIFNPM